MKKFFEAIKKNKILLLVAVIIDIVCLVSLVWVYTNNVARAADKSLSAPIYTEYDTTTAEIEDGKAVAQQFETDKDVCGIVVKFKTNKAIVNGSVTAELLQNNIVVATGSLDMAQILDGVPIGIIFDNIIKNNEKTTFVVNIVANYAPENTQLLSMWKDGGKQSVLYENSTKSDGAIFLTTVVNKSDTFLKQYYLIIAIVIFLALSISFSLIFVIKPKLHIIFFVCVMLFGVGYNLVFPPNTAPDEKVHVNTAYALSNRILGIDQFFWPCTVNKDYSSYKIDSSKLDTFAYQEYKDNLFKSYPTKETNGEALVVATSVSYISYAPTVVGILVTRIFNANYVTMVFVARFFNLLFFAMVVAFAIKIIPFGKNILFAVGFLPMCVSLAASFSYDIFTIAIAFLYIAFCLNLAYTQLDKKITIRQYILLAILAILLAPAKAIYIFICGMCFVIPKQKFKNAKIYIAAMSGIVLVSAISFFAINFNSLKYYVGNLTPENISNAQTAVEPPKVQEVPSQSQNHDTGTDIVSTPDTPSSNDVQIVPNAIEPEPETEIVVNYIAEFYYSPSYILAHKRDAVKLVANTVQHNTLYYLRQMVGGHLSEPIMVDVNINGIFVAGLYLCLILSCLQVKKDLVLMKPRHKLWAIFVVACVLCVLFVVVLNWTPSDSPTLWGMQGRYLLPVLPLVMFVLQGKTVVLEKDITGKLCFAMCFLHFFVLLNAFVAIQ